MFTGSDQLNSIASSELVTELVTVVNYLTVNCSVDIVDL